MSWRFLYIGKLFRTHWPSEVFPDFKWMKWLCDISAAKITLMLTMVQKRKENKRKNRKWAEVVWQRDCILTKVSMQESTEIGHCAFWFNLTQLNGLRLLPSSTADPPSVPPSAWTFCHQLKPWYLPKWIQSKCRWPGNAVCLTVGPFSQVLRHKVKIKSQSVRCSRWMTGPVYSSA